MRRVLFVVFLFGVTTAFGRGPGVIHCETATFDAKTQSLELVCPPPYVFAPEIG
ncbi:MAG: hypothetical protein LAN62_11885 [Acidobacteriia bacterium]|nr:hypothetical protein [Terriglobia bacterium]